MSQTLIGHVLTWLRRLPHRLLLAGLFACAYYLAFWLRFEGHLPEAQLQCFAETVGWMLLLKLAVYTAFRVPSGFRGYLSFRELAGLIEAATLSSLLMAAADYLFYPQFMLPRSVFLMDWGVSVLFVGGMRAVTRLMQERYQPLFVGGDRVRVLIVGANESGEALLRALERSREQPYQVVGFVDPSAGKLASVGGVRLLGTLEQTCALARRHQVQEVLIAAGQLSGRAVRQLKEECGQHGINVKVLPSFEQLMRGGFSGQARNVSIEDLLRRDPVKLDVANIQQWLSGRVIMVTGGSGSIGSEICRQLLQFSPRRLVIVDRAETPQFFVERELRAANPHIDIQVCIADICDRARMTALFERHQPDILFHAAAFKHVPLMEDNPGEAVKNNIVATQRLADLAEAFELQSFVLISTDKAVNPSSVMGACKRLAERYIQALARRSACRFVTVRFGNVLDSAGSVVPVFRQQIAQGGPVTVTDPRMERYFMTIPEAAQLVIQAGAMGQGGEIFVLDMGDPLSIVELARDMIRLSGYREGEEIEIQFTGLRPGEKLTEELHAEGETHLPTRHPKIVIADSEPADVESLTAVIEHLRLIADQPNEAIISELRRAVGKQLAAPPVERLRLFGAGETEAA